MTLDILLRETRKRWTGSRRRIVRPPLFSRASGANIAAPVWSAVTVPNVTRRGLPSRRSRSTHNLDPSGWPRSMNPRSVASRTAYLRPRRCAASTRASLRRMRPPGSRIPVPPTRLGVRGGTAFRNHPLTARRAPGLRRENAPAGRPTGSPPRPPQPQSDRATAPSSDTVSTGAALRQRPNNLGNPGTGRVKQSGKSVVK